MDVNGRTTEASIFLSAEYLCIDPRDIYYVPFEIFYSLDQRLEFGED